MELLIYIAIGPAVYLLYHVYKKDRLEKEPAKLLWKLGGFGALCAVPAVLLELAGEVLCVLLGLGSGLLYHFIENFFVVALAEEGCKYLALNRLTRKNKEFNCTYDGLLYAVYVSMGFAIIENLLYIMLGGGAITGIFRAVTAIPGHCFFGVFMGFFYSKAKLAEYYGDKAKARRLRLAGLGTAVAVHGLYDFLLSVGGAACVSLFFVLLIAMYIVGFKTVNRASREDKYIDICEEEFHRSEERWCCPACGTENDGVVCIFCGWNIPKSGSTEVPAEPVKPVRIFLQPQPKTKLPLSAVFLIILSFILPFALAFALTFGLMADFPGSRNRDLVEPLLVIFALLMTAGIILPIVLSVKFEKKRAALDPDYAPRLEEYRKAEAEYQKKSSEYTAALNEYNDYKSAVKRAEKLRKKQSEL